MDFVILSVRYNVARLRKHISGTDWLRSCVLRATSRGPDGQPADLHTYEMVEVNDDSDEDDFEIDDDDEHTMAADGAKKSCMEC